jgi:hypothetical protein
MEKISMFEKACLGACAFWDAEKLSLNSLREGYDRNVNYWENLESQLSRLGCSSENDGGELATNYILSNQMGYVCGRFRMGMAIKRGLFPRDSYKEIKNLITSRSE